MQKKLLFRNKSQDTVWLSVRQSILLLATVIFSPVYHSFALAPLWHLSPSFSLILKMPALGTGLCMSDCFHREGHPLLWSW